MDSPAQADPVSAAQEPTLGATQRFDGIAVFLDLLGFKNHLAQDLAGAHLLLVNVQEILRQKLIDQHMIQTGPPLAPECLELAATISVDSFEYFLPASDSIFIAGRDASSVVTQLSRFLEHLICFLSGAYNHPDNTEDPSDVVVSDYSSQGVVRRNEKWFPPMFRGGLAFGEIVATNILSVQASRPRITANLFGPAIVEAVAFEASGRGPRLFCRDSFAEHLNDRLRKFVVPTRVKGCSEFLWPAVMLDAASGAPPEVLSGINELLGPTIGLWKGYGRLPNAGQQYHECVRLVFRSALHWARLNSVPNAREIIDRLGQAHGVDYRKFLKPYRPNWSERGKALLKRLRGARLA